jgi:hypothetical protein
MSLNGTEKTKLSQKEWRDLILAELKGKGRGRYYSAICPICLISYDVDILDKDASARVLAVEKAASQECALRRFELRDKCAPQPHCRNTALVRPESES